MGSLDTIVGKYLRLADDLHEMRAYLNDIRICFVAMTLSVYVGIILYAFIVCIQRRSGSDDSSDNSGGRLRNVSQRNQRRSNSRFEGANYDAEAAIGGGVGGDNTNTNEWDDMMPPPPNGSAVKTLDGYRYRNAGRATTAITGGVGGNKFAQHRLSVNMDALDPAILTGGGKRQQLIVDNHTAMSSSMQGLPFTMGRRTPSDHAFRDGFIEKSPSIA